jgi:hypothetical protein
MILKLYVIHGTGPLPLTRRDSECLNRRIYGTELIHGDATLEFLVLVTDPGLKREL